MVGNEPEELNEMDVDAADMVVDKSPQGVPPVTSSQVASAEPSVLNGGAINESDFIGRFSAERARVLLKSRVTSPQ